MSAFHFTQEEPVIEDMPHHPYSRVDISYPLLVWNLGCGKSESRHRCLAPMLNGAPSLHGSWLDRVANPP